jgi:short-subunit dehydrogenase
MGGFTGCTSVITGAGSGIGRALALELAAEGARLVLWDRDRDAVEGTARRCREAGAVVRVDVVDVRDARSVLERAADVRQEVERVGAVFCVAGIIHTGGVLESQVTDVRDVVDVNLMGVVHAVMAFLPLLISSGGGHVVTVSSAFGLVAAPRYAAYSASKFAVRGFTEALRQEMVLDRLPVRVSCAYPGGVRTQIVRRGLFARPQDADAVSARFDASVARMEPEEAARVILRGVRHGRARILVGGDARLVSVVARVAGGAYQRVVPSLLRMTQVTRASRDANMR